MAGQLGPEPSGSVRGGSKALSEGMGRHWLHRAGGLRPVGSRSPPSPPAVTAAGLLTSSCAGLRLNPPSCLISKANSFSDKSMSRGCPGSALSPPCNSERQGSRRDLQVCLLFRRDVQPRPQGRDSPRAGLCFLRGGRETGLAVGTFGDLPKATQQGAGFSVWNGVLSLGLARSDPAVALVGLFGPPCFLLTPSRPLQPSCTP